MNTTPVASPAKFEHRILECIDCGEPFIFTAGEQQFFADKKLEHEPRRCKDCRARARDRRRRMEAGRS